MMCPFLCCSLRLIFVLLFSIARNTQLNHRICCIIIMQCTSHVPAIRFIQIHIIQACMHIKAMILWLQCPRMPYFFMHARRICAMNRIHHRTFNGTKCAKFHETPIFRQLFAAAVVVIIDVLICINTHSHTPIQLTKHKYK